MEWIYTAKWQKSYLIRTPRSSNLPFSQQSDETWEETCLFMTEQGSCVSCWGHLCSWPHQQIWINKTLWITKDVVGHYEGALQNDVRQTRKCQRWLWWNPMDLIASSGCFSGAQKPRAHWTVPVHRYPVGQSRVSVQLLWVGLWPWGSPVEFMSLFSEKTDQATSTARMTFISILDDDHIIIQTHLKNPQ